MIFQDKKGSGEGSSQQEPANQLRRTSRVAKAKNDDCYLMGHQELDRLIGFDPMQEEVGAKRHRKNYCYEDGSDYSDHKRNSIRKCRPGSSSYRSPPLNAVEGLLKWREELQPCTSPNNLNSKFVRVKSICKQQLDRHAQGIEALFVNIDWNKKGQTLEDFQSISIQSRTLMEKGLVFIWTPKDLIAGIMEIMEMKGFQYVENLEVALLDRKKAERIYLAKNHLLPPEEDNGACSKSKAPRNGKKEPEGPHGTLSLPEIIAALENIDPNELVCRIPSKYFNSSRKTLFIFRKSCEERVELRHQRTCDVVFDMPLNPQGKCEEELKAYLFTMIETMLPRCLEREDQFKMMELWGSPESRRRGWVTLIEQ